ncbi:hypothetical protein [Klebsiella sp. BIGb0407]|uniref:hypothetical protein n=1 Tax=Klebsiella sp. BIGb0407 TaxID=2940603 RepID=UPI0021670752|nr:hypothetical protein [Klebsiella sp. BIGb0407]MCS3434042.1 hypothetical protein [Klebsiella sp. BIGb0407]
MTNKKLPLEANNEQSKWFTSGELARIGKEKAENAACYPDYADMDIPTTAKGVRVRLESVTTLNPQLRKKNPNKRGDLYHIDAFKIILNSDEKEMIKQNTQSIESTDLNLLLEIYKSLPADKRKELLKTALTIKKNDLG